jgi:phosphoribosylaminoimidazolecarboxamide formyltransferase / IMP cyclohydrolase
LAELKAGGLVTADTRRKLAVKGFQTTTHYDAAIAAYLAPDSAQKPDVLAIRAYPVQTLRYGENPHQSAVFYTYEPGMGPLGGKVLQGKELSYNNLLDMDAAWRAAVSFTKPSICIVKHLTPCGVASADKLVTAYRAAFACDTISAFGGVIASNQPFDGATAEAIGSLFVECIAAPGFTPEAREILAKKKNLRLIEMPDTSVEPRYELRSITRGMLKQDVDFGDPENTEWKVVSKRQPTEAEWEAMRFAWKACQYVKSNAIVFGKAESDSAAEKYFSTVGIGSGQPNRVDSVRLAVRHAGEKANGSVMASDAFFPFPDSVEVAASAGITAVVYPGGSVKDADSIAAADAANMAMVATGVRHFRH